MVSSGDCVGGKTELSLVDAPLISTVVSEDSKMYTESNYDGEVTTLFRCLESKQWDEALLVCEKCAEESSIWIYRIGKTGKLRWKMLPIHAAVIFEATSDVLEAIINAYPEGLKQADDQGMLPVSLFISSFHAQFFITLN